MSLLNSKKKAMGRPSKEAVLLRTLQQQAQTETARNMRMYRAIRDSDKDVLAEFGMKIADINAKMKIDAANKIVAFATAAVKELSEITDNDVKRVENETGTKFATFQTWASEANRPAGAQVMRSPVAVNI